MYNVDDTSCQIARGLCTHPIVNMSQSHVSGNALRSFTSEDAATFVPDLGAASVSMAISGLAPDNPG